MSLFVHRDTIPVLRSCLREAVESPRAVFLVVRLFLIANVKHTDLSLAAASAAVSARALLACGARSLGRVVLEF